MKIKAIIFDVDGTLADTEEAHRLSFNRAFLERNLNWSWDVSLYNDLLKVTGGKERIKYFVTTYATDFQKPADYDAFVKDLHLVKTSHYIELLRKGGIPLRPNIERLLMEAKGAGLRLAIATTTSRDNVVTLLQQNLGLNGEALFDVIGCADTVHHKKPAPNIYLLVLEKLGLKAVDCIALEDSENGLHAALLAGLKTFITTNCYTDKQNFDGAEMVLDDLNNLEHFYQCAGLNFSGNIVSN